MRQPALFWIAIVAQVAGLVTFGRWLLQTDFLFGHYSGPLFLLLTALAVLGLGIGTALVWLGRAVFGEFRANGKSDWTTRGIVGGLLLMALSMVTGFCGFYGGAVLLYQMDVR